MGSAVKKVATIAVGLVVGLVTENWYLAAAIAASAFATTATPDVASTTSEPSSQTLRSANAASRYILGRVSTGGVLAFAAEQSGDDAEDEKLHLVYVLCEGAIDGVEAIYLNDEHISTYGDKAAYEVHINRTTADPYLLANAPGWKSSMVGRGLSWVRLTLTYDQEKFPSGIPDAQFIVRGRNDIYDPRTGTSGYSENTALHILWYLRNRCGVPDDEIIMDTFISAANVCAEAVVKPEGGTEPRYTTGAVIGADERRDQVMQKLEDSCAGNLIVIGGRWELQVGAYYGPADFTITEDMVVGEVSGSTETSNADAVNTITGTFVDPAQNWEETDYPQVQVAEWVTEDGGESSESVNYSYVNSAYQAQRLGNIKLRLKRAAGTISMQLNFNGYSCRPGRVVTVDLPSLNIYGEFIVQDWSLDSEEAVKVTLAQSDADVYDDAVGVAYDPLGFISLPTGGVPSPTNLVWETKVRGDAVQGVVSWSYSSSVATAFNVVVRDSNDDVAYSVQVPGSTYQCNIGGLDAGTYSISVSARAASGRSGEASISITINLPPVPDRVITTIGNREVTLIPLLPAGTDLGGGTFRYYVTQGTDVAQPEATYIGQGLTFTHTGLSPQQTYYYYVQSVNAYGASGFLRVEVMTTLNFDEEMAYINQDIYREGGLADALTNDARTAAEEAAGELVAPFQQQIADNDQAIQDLDATVDTDGVLAAIRLSAMSAKTQLGAAVQDTQRIVRITETDALSQRIDTTRVEFGDDIAEVREEVTAVYDPATGAVARAVTTVDVNGRKGMLGIQVDGQVAEIIGVADRFAILNEISGEYVTAFVVQDGRVVIPDALIRDASITNAKIANATIQTAKIADAAITAAKIQDASITSAKIQDAAITSAKIQDAAITSAKIGDASIDTLKLAGNSVTIPLSTFNAAEVSSTGDWITVAQATMNPLGAPVYMHASFTYSGNGGFRTIGSATAQIQLDVRVISPSGTIEFLNIDFKSEQAVATESGTYITARALFQGQYSTGYQFPAYDGNATYQVQIRAMGSTTRTVKAWNRSLFLLGVRR